MRAIMSRLNNDGASKRLEQLRRVLNTPLSVRRSSSSSRGDVLSIGDQSIVVKPAKYQELVPRLYVPELLSQSTLRHLRWIIQKDLLGQDVFLIGPSGPLKRHLSLLYCELTQREVEYISLSRDTTEADLKQRREIINGTAHYIDQCAVRAATKGRVLVIEGIEKAERNVLPVLNNLLENREMALEDGRFLMSPTRYDKLLKEHGQETLDFWRLARVSDQFRVIALGLPVPPYHGNPLDPPLRSRFQARNITHLPFHEQLESLKGYAPNVPDKLLSSVLSVCSTLQTLSGTSHYGLMDFPMHQLNKLVQILNTMPSTDISQLLNLAFPSELLGKREMLSDAMTRFQLLNKRQGNGNNLSVTSITPPTSETQESVTVAFNDGGAQYSVPVPGRCQQQLSDASSEFVSTAQSENLIAQMIQSHSVGDFCIVGEKGTGKTVLVNEFAHRLGYETEPVMVYWDMTARDLCQQRVTLPNGDTSWRLTPLIDAALKGRLAVLDGINRLDMGTLAVLQRLIHDREIDLFDGTKLLGSKHFNEAKTHAGLDDLQMAEKSIYRIDDKFRIVATAKPQSGKSSGQHYTNHWSNPEFVSMFLFHHVKPLSFAEEEQVLPKKVSGLTSDRIEPLLHFVHGLRQSKVPMVQSLASSLSTRQLLRIARRMVNNEENDLFQAVTKACLFRFLPQTVKATLLQSLREAGIKPKSITKDGGNEITCQIHENTLKIGNTTMQLKPHHDLEALVPHVLFYENQQHLQILEDMLKDYILGEHLLLVGNQGVGKNKLVDHFLHLLNLPREYLQLHRDTTVQTLTLQPSVRDGQIVYQDSPLVRAVKSGTVLVVDEADKAPTHVTCILKNLVENSEITLADGRRIVPYQAAVSNSDSVIVRNPDFRMMVLANRPGFPFLGNDFFASIGDMFSCHAIDNPDLQSEMTMLKQYGPTVSDDILKKLVSAFAELRQMSDAGSISYPYSTREVVNIVKHLEKFPGEGVASVVRNVFDFDSYHHELLEVVMKALHKHGIPVGASLNSVQLSQEHQLPPLKVVTEWNISPNVPTSLKVVQSPMKTKGPYRLNTTICPLDRIEDRGKYFSELKSHWTIPMHETSYTQNIATGPGGHIHVAIRGPVAVYSMRSNSDSMQCIDLSAVFPYPTSIWSPQLNLAGLGNELEGQLLVQDVNSNLLLLINPRNGSASEIVTQSLMKKIASKLTRNDQENPPKYHMCTELAADNVVILYQEGSSEFLCVDISNNVMSKLDVPFLINSINVLSHSQWIATSLNETSNSFLLYKSSASLPAPDSISPIESTNLIPVLATSTTGLKPNDLGDALQLTVDENTPASYSRIVATPSSLAAVATGLPFESNNKVKIYSSTSPSNYANIAERKPVLLPVESQVVYPLLPASDKKHIGVSVIDLARHSLKEIKLKDLSSQNTPYYQRNTMLHAAKLGDDCVVTVDGQGLVQILETGHFALHESLKQWKQMLGKDLSKALQMSYQRSSGKDVSLPKHGKVDPSNAPHVGGNTWAGGTGGRDTAGLGGKGGPYRLDAGHDVFQVSDAEKDAVPNEVKKAAREMGQKAFKAKLREIQMSEHDAKLYEQFLSKVNKQINSIQLILNNVQSKGLERQWIKHQTSGDLDDGKLIEGLTGERAIYKRRGEKQPEFGSPQLLPKCFRLVVDVSGSMYRFNGLDGRLERTLEATLMILEGFNKHHDKFKLDIVGHSGDAEDIQFVKSSAPPTNDKERLDVLKTMHAHSQYCWPGDNTLPATKVAIKEITKESADEYFVVVLSDANFSRYNINPDEFAKLLNSDPKVNTFAVVIGSLGDQAEQLKKCLPAGRAFICMDAADLPQILQQIFTSTLS